MRLPLTGNAVLIAGIGIGCGVEEVPPDWSFSITASTKEQACVEVAELLKNRMPGTPGYSDICGPDVNECGDLDPDTVKESLQYDVYFDGANASIEIDGQPFASGLSIGCDFEYETPTWLEEKPDGPVTWKLKSMYTQANGAGVCDIEGGYDWLGIEEITVVDSENLSYPAGCTYRMAMMGEALAVEE